LLDMTAMIGFGGQIGLRVAFSFQNSLVDALYSEMTAGFDDIPGEVGTHREAVIGEVVNIILGHCTIDLQHLDQHGIPMTPPHILGRGAAISGADGDMFYTQGFNTERGRLAISLVGPGELFDMDRDYAK
jgi:CheY-specific phosphatase CheX